MTEKVDFGKVSARMILPMFKRSHSFWDQVGMIVSSLCFIHCLVTPFLILSLPWLWIYMHDPYFHLAIFLLVVPIGLYAFLQGYKHHKNKWVLFLGIPGLFIVGLGAFIPHEVIHFIGHGHEKVTILGSLMLVIAHYTNRRSCQKHNH